MGLGVIDLGSMERSGKISLVGLPKHGLEIILTFYRVLRKLNE
jgi:hypothetical protein